MTIEAQNQSRISIMNDLIEACIAKDDPGKRSVAGLQSLLPWFRRYGKDVLRDATDGMLIEILQNCSYMKINKDQIIIFQGDLGDSFYILIDGNVSIYVRDADYSTEEPKKKRQSLIGKDLRNVLGTCVLSEGEGYSFGEYALLDEKCLRKATVIANEECRLISIDRVTYNNSIKNLQNNILMEREHFIKNSALFGDCATHTRELIKMSLKKVTIPYECNLVTQGERWEGLTFIIKGSARLTVETNKHPTQYPDLFPLDFTVYDERYREFPELKPPLPTADRSEEECVADLTPMTIRLKRAGDYAALERHVLNHNKIVCTVQSGEIIGDLELIFNLKTNIYSVTCTETTEAFILDSVHFERIFKKNSPKFFIENLKNVIRTKLDHRERYFIEIPIPLMLFLKNKLYENTSEYHKALPKMITEKILPNQEAEWQHLLKMYLQNKAPLFLPYIKGSVYLKDLMKVNANHRRRVKEAKLIHEDGTKQFTTNYIENFPIRQQSIYRLQTKARDPVHFMEMIQKELKKTKVKRPNILVDIVSRSITKDSFGGDLKSKVPTYINLLSDRESESIGRPTPRLQPTKSEIKVDELNDSMSKLQKSEMSFLNALCSDKSRYAMKLNKEEIINKKNIHTHFLPSLQTHIEINSKDQPKRGAKVMIKQRPCDALASPYRLVGHIHKTHKIVTKIEDDRMNSSGSFAPQLVPLNLIPR